MKYGEARSTWTVRDFGGSVLICDERYPSPTEDPQWTCPGGGVWVFCDGFESGNTAAWSSISTGRNRKISDYVWREGQLLGSETLNEIRRHFGLDHPGTPRLVTNDFGEVLAQHTYFPFGQEATSTAQDAEPMKFTGHERDLKSTPANPADDLDYLHARYSSPVLGRFLSTDAIGGTPHRPQSWNRYGYVGGNPLIYVDPDGLRKVVSVGSRYQLHFDTAHSRELAGKGVVNHFDLNEKRGGKWVKIGRYSTTGGTPLRGTTAPLPRRVEKFLQKGGFLSSIAISEISTGVFMFFDAAPAGAQEEVDWERTMLLRAALAGELEAVAQDIFGPGRDVSSLSEQELQQVITEYLRRASEEATEEEDQKGKKRDTGEDPKPCAPESRFLSVGGGCEQ